MTSKSICLIEPKRETILFENSSSRELVKLKMADGGFLAYYYVLRDLISQSDSLYQVKIQFKVDKFTHENRKLFTSTSGKLVAMEID